MGSLGVRPLLSFSCCGVVGIWASLFLIPVSVVSLGVICTLVSRVYVVCLVSSRFVALRRGLRLEVV